MPFYCREYQERFTWDIAAGQPVADVITLGGVFYTAACPLCGAMLELPRSAKHGQVITPRCLIREYVSGKHGSGSVTGWKLLYDEWLAIHPDAAAYSQIRVKLVSLAELMERPALKVVKPRKPRAAATKAKTTSPRTRKAKAA